MPHEIIITLIKDDVSAENLGLERDQAEWKGDYHADRDTVSQRR
jgi:hypothetical protein